MIYLKKRIKIYIILLFILALAACAAEHEYKWSAYPIAPERISPQVTEISGQQINIIEGHSDDSRILLGEVGPHKYYGSKQLLAEGIVEQLTIEMLKNQIVTKNTASKSLEITVNRTNFERGMWKIAATIEFAVKLGNGKSKFYTVRNSSPSTLDNTFNGAVALAVLEVINDYEVLNYIKE